MAKNVFNFDFMRRALDRSPASSRSRRPRPHLHNHNLSDATYSPSATFSSQNRRSCSYDHDVSDTMSVFSGFHNYTPIADDEIRLLRLEPGNRDDTIRGTLPVFSTNQTPPYNALSYEWGSEEHKKDIFLNGRRIQVRRNLWYALHQLRSSQHPSLLWVDAVCINQGDNGEKFQQVAQMGQFYRHAACTICWLGVAEHNSDDALDTINTFAAMKQRSEDTRRRYWCSLPEETVEGILNIAVERTYWQRMWIRQEIILSEEVIIQCGNRQVSLDLFQHAMGDFDRYYRLAVHNARALLDFVIDIKDLNEERKTIETPKDSYWLLSRLIYSRACNATDSRDKVFGLLGLFHLNAPADAAFRIQADYRLSVRDVYLHLFRYCVFSADNQPRQGAPLYILCASWPTQNPHGLPSWLPDWSNAGARGCEPWPIDSLSRLNVLANVRIRQDNAVLRCEGFCFSSLRTLGVTKASVVTTSEQCGPAIEPYGKELALAHDWLEVASRYIRYEVNPRHASMSRVSIWRKFMSVIALGYDWDEGLDWRRILDDWEATFRTSDRRHPRPPYCPPSLPDLIINTLVSFYSRYFTFAISEDGDFMRVPNHAEIGDVVCILFGCETSLVLRPCRDRRGHSHYTFVGKCCVEKEAVDIAVQEWEGGERRTERFDIH